MTRPTIPNIPSKPEVFRFNEKQRKNLKDILGEKVSEADFPQFCDELENIVDNYKLHSREEGYTPEPGIINKNLILIAEESEQLAKRLETVRPFLEGIEPHLRLYKNRNVSTMSAAESMRLEEILTPSLADIAKVKGYLNIIPQKCRAILKAGLIPSRNLRQGRLLIAWDTARLLKNRGIKATIYNKGLWYKILSLSLEACGENIADVLPLMRKVKPLLNTK